jgi:hypothetical protein
MGGLMTSHDTRRALLATLDGSGIDSEPGGISTPISASRLTDHQLAGAACIWCAAPITDTDRHEVGFTGYPSSRLYGCARCVITLRRRLPIWPESGSA